MPHVYDPGWKQKPVEAEMKRALTMPESRGMSTSKVRRLIRQYHRDSAGGPTVELGPYFLAYKDDTGETAIVNVMAKKGKGLSAVTSSTEAEDSDRNNHETGESE